MARKESAGLDGTWRICDSTRWPFRRWLTAALTAAGVVEIGYGHGPVHHFHEIWSH